MVADPIRSLTTRPSADHWRRLAVAGLTVLFLALVRDLTEVYRLRATDGPSLPLTAVEIYIRGALLVAVGCWLAVTLFVLGRHVWTVGVALATVALLVAIKLL